MQIHSLPVGGAFGVVVTVVSLVTAVYKAAFHSYMLLYQIKWKCHQHFSEDSRFPIYIKPRRCVFILKCAGLMFTQGSQPPQISQCLGNTGNVYRKCLKIISLLLNFFYRNILNYCPALFWTDIQCTSSVKNVCQNNKCSDKKYFKLFDQQIGFENDW